MHAGRLILMVIGMGLATSGGATAAEIQLRSTAHPQGPLVLLGDVAEIFASDAKQAESLRRTELFPSPAVGSKRFVRQREIQDVLELRGISLAEHTFAGAGQVAVSTSMEAESAPVVRASRAQAPVEVRQACKIVQEAIIGYLEANASAVESWNVQCDLDDDAIRAVLAAGRLESVAGGQAPWTGSQEFTARLPRADGGISIRAKVSVTPAVVVATHAVPRGAVIQATDVQLDRSVPATGKAELATSLDEVIGKEAAQAIVAGRPVDRNAVRQPVLVRKGDVVTVYARSPGVQVRTNARAKDTGSHGEMIAVESLENRQSYFARVTGLQEAEVCSGLPNTAESSSRSRSRLAPNKATPR